MSEAEFIQQKDELLEKKYLLDHQYVATVDDDYQEVMKDNRLERRLQMGAVFTES